MIVAFEVNPYKEFYCQKTGLCNTLYKFRLGRTICW